MRPVGRAALAAWAVMPSMTLVIVVDTLSMAAATEVACSAATAAASGPAGARNERTSAATA